MKLSEANIVKTLDNFDEIKQKAISLIVEMGFKNKIDENNLILFVNDTNLIVRNPLYGEEFKLPLTYLLDKEGEHENEHKLEEEERTRLNLSKVKAYIK